MRGKYEAELWLSKDSAISNDHWLRARTQTFERLGVGVAPRDRGPSGIYKGTLTVEVTADQVVIDTKVPLKITGEGLRNCKLSQPYQQKVILECEIFRLSTQQEPQALFYMFVRFPDDFSVSRVTIARTAYPRHTIRFPAPTAR